MLKRKNICWLVLFATLCLMIGIALGEGSESLPAIFLTEELPETLYLHMPCSIRWHPVDGASYYSMVFYLQSGKTEKYAIGHWVDPSQDSEEDVVWEAYEIEDCNPGTYRLELTAINPEGETIAELGPTFFTLSDMNQPVAPPAPTVDDGPYQYLSLHFVSLDQVYSRAQMKMEGQNPADFEIQDNGEFGCWTLIVSPPYQWRVGIQARYLSADGIWSRWSQATYINVEEPEKITEQPIFTAPETVHVYEPFEVDCNIKNAAEYFIRFGPAADGDPGSGSSFQSVPCTFDVEWRYMGEPDTIEPGDYYLWASVYDVSTYTDIQAEPVLIHVIPAE